MNRRLLAVGCDAYRHLPDLEGAVTDAKRFYKTMIRPECGCYEHAYSKLLTSPLLADLRESLRSILFDSGSKLDTFTFFFAGHGGVKAGAYYMCTRDSRLEMLSATAFGMAELFSLINEAAPRQSNIVLDACEGGGIVADLHAVIKPELIGGFDTPAISIFASSAADQYSGDSDAGGIGTINLMGCIEGNVVVQTTRPSLDLLEIGRVASSSMAEQDIGQVPVLWGLNLYGEARFCKNLHYAGLTPATAAFPQIPVGSPQYNVIKAHADQIWREYLAIDGEFDSRRLLDTLAPLVSAMSSETNDAPAFVRGLAEAFTLRAAGSVDMFRSVEVLATCSVSLLQQIDANGSGAAIVDLAGGAQARGHTALEELAGILSKDAYGLLSVGTGFGDLFYLPLRICRVLGWIGAQHFVGKWIGQAQGVDEVLLRRLLAMLFDTYSSSLVSVSDTQASYLLTFLSCCRERGWNDAAEWVVGHMFNTFVAGRGNVARANVDRRRVFELLNRRLENKFGDAFDLFAHPSETLAVLLMAAHWFGMEDVIDPYLHCLDHHSFNLFIPKNHRECGRAIIHDGVNHTYEVGNGIWRTEDFVMKWMADAARTIEADPSINVKSVKLGALYASLLFPDRCPWFMANSG